MDIGTFLAEQRLPGSYVRTIERVHVPLAAAIHRKCLVDRTFVVGICGAQGSGKSTTALALQALLQDRGVATAVLSLDDLYLTRAERQSLAARVHPLFATRGVPGTHDVELGLRTIRALRHAQRVAVPVFDKASDDRLPESEWREVDGPVGVVLFEGWCVGARAQDEAALAVPLNELERTDDASGSWRRYANEALRGSYQCLFAELDALILLWAPGFEVVLEWRREQERKLRERLGPRASSTRVMSDGEIARFVSCYERLTRHILTEMPPRADAVVKLDADREVLDLTICGRLS